MTPDLVVFAAVTEPIPFSRSSPGPGARSRSSHEDVLGVDMQVYAKRMRTLRELMAQSAARADVDFVVQGTDADRLTFGSTTRGRAPVAAALRAARRRRGRPRRVVLGEQPRLGRDVLGVRRCSARSSFR